MDTLALFAAALLAVVWVLYPLAISVAAAFTRRRPSVAAVADPFVSVVIASREDHQLVRERVANCLDTRYPAERLEVIVARDHAAAGEAASFPPDRVRLVSADAPGGKAAALNAGIRASRGEVIVFADSAQRFDRSTIPELVAGLGGDRVGAVSGMLEITGSSLSALYWRYERRLRRLEARVHSSIGATGAVYAIRRELWRPLPAGLLLDDVYTPMAIVLGGWRVGFVESARAFESRSPTPRQEYVRKVRTLTGVLQLCAWMPDLLLPFRNPVWLQFVFHKLLRMLTPYALAVLAAWLLVSSAGFAGAAILLPAIAAAAALLWLASPHIRWAGRLRHLIAEGALIQWAVVTAGINGLRGRWEVWDA